MGEVVNLPAKLSPSPPTPPALYFCANLDCKPVGYHVVSSSQPLSTGSFGPLDFFVLCSSILDFTCDVHEDQVMDEVGVEHPTCAIIFYEYVWEYE